jgi:hypothetical protein
MHHGGGFGGHPHHATFGHHHGHHFGQPSLTPPLLRPSPSPASSPASIDHCQPRPSLSPSVCVLVWV